jgi:hypothetical protein
MGCGWDARFVSGIFDGSSFVSALDGGRNGY